MSTDTSAITRRDPSPISGNAIVRVGPVNPTVAQALVDDYDSLVLPDAGDARDQFLNEHGEAIRVAVCSGKIGVDTELMKRLPNLEAIVNFGVGYDASDVAQAAERNIPISNTPDVLTDCVADTALGLYLNTLRSLGAAERFVRAGTWATGANFPLATRASSKRVGILGLGRIGAAIAKRLEAFGCEIHYHNRSEISGSPYTYHPSAAALAEATDVLVVAAAGGPASAGLVDATVLEAIGPKGFLINIARGSVVDEQALVAALQNGTIAGAGLDVFVNEPHAPEELFALENVVLLPHLGSGTHETRADMAALVLDNLRSYVDSGELITPVS
ncbi:2-hydroxyacid dehydrogenase [Paeniglutamicibacter psychrophenolicus]|uniref:Lactate dehydrogenase-like 2-hydroxyacid dehydrogenase n=1 Tax=Paeniglutamicibacter psychrophenolicus TaxID=257454 RepID=A0ABS4WAR9_9MICC|nr:2-hydroxyacid dehydrogenase [Paeniglutamicibacter psychrophenolicus]MBP2373013.1 lactate dehydrogenase-like 2-hydroxyacid dehydrogenase [Paeniglutamicibacter psychrophenolicus]